jgi:serine protease AprX
MVIGNSQYGHRYIFFDEVEISYLRPSAYLATVGADRLHSELGLEGQGVTVAVVDSGVANHLDLQAPGEEGSRLIASTNLTDSADAEDWFGHGTHVAGIIGGNGSLSASNRRGVAPGVNLINIKVSGDQGAGYVSDLIEGLQWIYDNKDTYNIRVVNISINSTIQEPYHASPIDAAVEILWMNGIVVVVSSGNNGTGDGPVTLYPPANDPFVITVGATDDLSTPDLNDDAVPAFSAYGTTEDNFIKPELVAPGRNIISLLSSTGSTIYDAHPAHRVDDYHFRMSGTSMAAPMVSGAAALLLQDEPNLTPDQVKFRLMATANTVWAGFDPAKAGAGYLDAYAAVTGTTTESANVGIPVSQMLWTGGDPITWDSVSWNSVAWNSVAWNSVAWNSVAWNSVAWSSGLWDD